METLEEPQAQSTPVKPRGSWRWFLAWSAIGAGLVLGLAGALTIGIFVVPVVVLGATRLVVRQASRPVEQRWFGSAWGALSGASLPIFVAAYANRRGPGRICTYTPTSSQCGEQGSPSPFAVIAILLLVSGIGAFAASMRLRGRADARVHSDPPVTIPTNSLAVVSLVMGIASITLSPPMGIAGLVTGCIARRQIRLARGTQVGSGLALGGILTSAVGLTVLTVALCLLLRSRL